MHQEIQIRLFLDFVWVVEEEEEAKGFSVLDFELRPPPQLHFTQN